MSAGEYHICSVAPKGGRMPRKLCRSAAKPCGEIELQGEKIAERAEAVVARADQLIRFDGAERAQLARKEHLEGGEHDAVAAGFEQDAVDDAEFVQVGGGHLQTLGGVGDLGGDPSRGSKRSPRAR